MSNSSPSSSPLISSSPGDAAYPIDATADLCGEVCPFTFVRTKLALEALPFGGVLRVVIDHEPAVRSIPRSATAWGQEVLDVRAIASVAESIDDRRWSIDIRRRVR